MSVNNEGMECDNEAIEENETECHLLVRQRKKLYEDELKRIDDEIGTDGTEVKMGVM